MEGVRIVPWSDACDACELTELLHTAYGVLQVQGMHFVAATQSVEATLARIRKGHCYLAFQDEVLVGTILLRPSDPASECVVYHDPDTAFFGQFAVAPHVQGSGIGRLLISHVEGVARDLGFRYLALDTAQPATHLIDFYEKLGYTFVDTVDWGFVNYVSNVYVKNLTEC